MTKLSDTQAVLLSNASQRSDGNVLPLPGSLRGGAQAKVIGALLKRGLIEERTIERHQKPDAALNTIWRNDDDGRAILLHITETGLTAIGIEPEDAGSAEAEAGADTAPDGATGAQHAGAATERTPALTKARPRATRWRTPRPSRRSRRSAPGRNRQC